MEITFTREAREHLEYWKKSGNITIKEKITSLLNEIQVMADNE